jgi:hypothetical protein
MQQAAGDVHCYFITCIMWQLLSFNMSVHAGALPLCYIAQLLAYISG